MSTSERRGRRVVSALSRTRTAIALVFQRRRSSLVFGVVTVLYLLTYLWVIGHLAPGLGGFDLLVVDDPLRAFFRPAFGPTSFRPVARVTFGPVTYLFSLNTVIGLGVATLVGLNVALTYLLWRQPTACGVGRGSAGALASIPALLSGTACCGPLVFVVLGIQASSALLVGFQLLLPVAIAGLVGSLVLVSWRLGPRQSGVSGRQ